MKRINYLIVGGLFLSAFATSVPAETTTVDVDFSETELTCRDADLVFDVTPEGVFRLAGQVRMTHQITSLFQQARLKVKRPVIACLSTTRVPSHRAIELAGLAKDPDDSVVFSEGESWTRVKLMMVVVTRD